MIKRTAQTGLVVALLVSLGSARTLSQELGTITFPTSGAPAAQAAFLEGVKSLHSFQFDEAAEAFRRAQEAAPDFVMAYWGEAMSYNHPLWAQQDTEAARKVLDKIAPTPEGRRAKAQLPTEKAFLDAADVLFSSPGDKLERDKAYADAMARMHARWPDDHEVATFYALSLLGTVRPGDMGFSRQALAASIALEVFDENPKHPGAAHFIIHAFDDPDHAPLGLPAARTYAAVAPAAAHALHMPSHIFVQRGMWQDVASSNTAAHRAAVDLNARMKLSEGREDFHTLSWLAYANLMLGRFDEARQNVERARQAMDRNPGSQSVRNGYLGMRARYILETEQWEKIALDTPHTTAGGEAQTGMPGMAAAPEPGGHTTWTFVVGVNAAKLGDFATAEAAEARLGDARQKAEAGDNPYTAKSIAIMEKEVAAITQLARGQTDEAVRLASEAAAIELTLDPPSGPPEPIQPAIELYGETLLAAGRPAEAAAAFERSLLRTPKRTPSLVGLARASLRAGKTTTARESYTEIANMPGAAPSSPPVQEAQRFLTAAYEGL